MWWKTGSGGGGVAGTLQPENPLGVSTPTKLFGNINQKETSSISQTSQYQNGQETNCLLDQTQMQA